MFFGPINAYQKAASVKGRDMTTSEICPFYGINDDYCDVGCGYISSHDVNMIIRYCNGHYQECAKYLELADRLYGKQGYGTEAGCMKLRPLKQGR